MPQPTQELQQAIELVHKAIVMEPEPDDKAGLGQILTMLMKIQAKNMMEAGGGGQGGPPQQQGPPSMMGGGSPPAGPQTAADPRLAALLGGMGR